MIFRIRNLGTWKAEEVWDQPFSDVYKGFHFIPYYAIEQLYYGVSSNSTYIGFSTYLEELSYDFPADFYQYDKFFPAPNIYLPNEIRNSLLPFLFGKKKFFIFKPNTFAYNFFLGFFLYLIWRLGGGYRISALYDPERYFPQFGFYDLAVTPLSYLFNFYFKINLYFGRISESQYQTYYVYNSRSLTGGYTGDKEAFNFNNIGKWHKFFAYFFWPIFSFLPALIIVSFFHFFLRPLLYHYIRYSGFISYKFFNVKRFTLIDELWVKIYEFYIYEVIETFKPYYPALEFKGRIVEQDLIAISYFVNRKSLIRYYKERTYYFFSKFFHYTFAFIYKFSKQIYNLKENKKINLYKDLVINSQIYQNPVTSFKLFPFQWLYTFMRMGWPNVVLAIKEEIIDELPKLYKQNRLSIKFILSQNYFDLPHSLLYDYTKSRFFYNSLRKFDYLSLRYNFFVILKNVVFTIIGYFYYFLYFFYSNLFFSLNFASINQSAFGASDFKVVLNYIIGFFKHCFFSYKFFFINFYYFLLYIFFLFYYEVRYIVVFIFESLRYYDYFRSKTYFYEYIYDYWMNFKNFFIASKFFRFFTREIGEDLEETAYSNILDFEDEDEFDFVSSFAAYQDLQVSSMDSYDEAYQVESLEQDVNYLHYYDYWLDTTSLNRENKPLYPNLEFFGDDLYSKDQELSLKTFVTWINPSALTLRGGFAEPLPYEAKDYLDDFDNSTILFKRLKKSDWYPFEITHQFEHDEDAIEYTNREFVSQVSYINHIATAIIPHDSDRYRLANFTKVYSKKLELWYSYQINNNFYKLPAVLKANTISIAHNPSTRIDWVKATHTASKFFLAPQELDRYSISTAQQLTLPQIDKIWERISYEVERNPRKLYDFLLDTDNNCRADAFNDTFFSFYKSKSAFSFSSLFIPKSNVLAFLDDYFSSYIDLSDSLKANSHYSLGLAKLDVIYTFNYLRYRAEYDFSNFYSKFVVLSQYKQFKELETTFHIISKYSVSNEQESSPVGWVVVKKLPDPFYDRIIYEYVQWFVGDQIIHDPLGEREGGWFSFFDFIWAHKTFHNIIPLKFLEKIFPRFFHNFYKSVRRVNRFYHVDSAFIDTQKHSLTYFSTESEAQVRTYENVFSLFLEQNFILNKILSERWFFKFASGSMFKDYRPENFVYYLLDGEDQAIRFTITYFDRLRAKKRSYFHYDQLFVGEIWNVLNPGLDDFFYEAYYLNNIFFPNNFKDIYFEELFPDDFISSSQDIYDDYMYYIGDDYLDFTTGEGEEIQPPYIGDHNDDDPDTLDVPDDTYWQDIEEYFDILDERHQGLAPHLLNAEEIEHIDDYYWFNDQWWFSFEHTINDEGLEDWEPDEYDAFYDVDISVDRLFFGGLMRKNALPATDQRLFLGPLWDSKNLDKDLDYSSHLRQARKNANNKSLISATFQASSNSQTSYPLNKKRFSTFRFIVLYVYRIAVYMLYYISSLLTNLYFIQSYSFNFHAKVNFYKHYYEWYKTYNALYLYKERLEDWVKFFESYLEPKIYKSYKLYNSKYFTAEPQNVDVLSNPYGRFWFQYPHTTYFREFAFYSNLRFPNRFHLIDAELFELKDGQPYYSDEKYQRTKLTYDDPITGYSKPPKVRPGGFGIKRKKNPPASPHYLERFYANDPFFNFSLVNNKHKKRLRKLTSYPWFFDKTRPETLGSDFTYMDLDFIEGLPENNDFSEKGDPQLFPHVYDPDALSFKHLYKKFLLFNNRLFKTSSGAALDINIPADYDLDGFLYEENDWDIGTMVSFSSDDVNSHVDEFRDKFDIFINAVEDFVDLISDYFSYYFHSKFRTYVLSYFKYWEVKSENYWLDFSVRFGIWVLILRNFINISLFLVLFFYGFFAISRIWYYIFGELFIYSWYSIFTFFFSFFLFFFLSRLIFKGANDFYKSMDIQDKLDMVFFAGLVWYAHILNGYLATDNSVFAVEPTPRLLSNNFDADFREGLVDWIYPGGRVRRFELVQPDNWVFRKGEYVTGRFHEDAATAEYGEEGLDDEHNEIFMTFSPSSYVPLAINPRIIYNFVRFHLFETYEQNFVGYIAYEHHVDKVGNSYLNITHTGIHRPQIVNWQAILSPQARAWMNRQILDQVLGGLNSASPYNYHSYTIDRLKSSHMVKANHINERLFTLAPDVTPTAPTDVFPYDVHPKFSYLHTTDYKKSKFSSNLYNTNEILSGYNSSFHRIRWRPVLIHHDVFPGVSLYDRDGRQLRGRRYKRNVYRGGFKNIEFKSTFKNTIFERTINNHWTNSVLIKRNFLQKYSQNLRKYLLYYNPTRAQSIRDIYGLALRDVYPFPEINELEQVNPIFFKNFKRLNVRQRNMLINVLKSENFESARLLLSRYNLPHYKQAFFPFYEATFSPIEDYFNYWMDYIEIWDEYLSEELPMDQWSETPPFNQSYYNQINRYYTEEFLYRFSHYLMRYRLEQLDEISNFFKDYITYLTTFTKINKNYRNRWVVNSEISYYSRLANINRTARAAFLDSYFAAVKFANKQAQNDYFRETLSYIKPYAQNRTYRYAAYKGFINGLYSKSRFKRSVYDRFYRLRTTKKTLLYRSKRDNKTQLYNSDLSYLNPVYQSQRRKLLRFRKKRRKERRDVVYTKGKYNYWYIDASLWNIFLDFIMVRDLFDNATSYETIFNDHRFPYKYRHYRFRRRKRTIKLPFNFTNRVVVRYYNTREKLFDENRRPTLVKRYLKNRKNFRRRMRKFISKPLYDVHETHEHYIRFTYSDHILAQAKPRVKAGRLNFRRSNIYARWRHAHWFDLTKNSAGPNERHKKTFFGVGTLDSTIESSIAVRDEGNYTGAAYTRRNHIIKAYTGVNMRQRAFMQYPKRSKYYGFPFNQRLIKHRIISRRKLIRGLKYIAQPLDKNYRWQDFQRYIPRNHTANVLRFKDFEKLWNKRGSYHYRRNRFLTKHARTLKRKVFLRAQAQNLRNMSKSNKKKFLRFNKHAKRAASHYKRLRKSSNFAPKAQLKVARKKRNIEDIRAWYLFGIAKADEARGEAYINLMRVKKRKYVLLRRKGKLQKLLDEKKKRKGWFQIL